MSAARWESSGILPDRRQPRHGVPPQRNAVVPGHGNVLRYAQAVVLKPGWHPRHQVRHGKNRRTGRGSGPAGTRQLHSRPLHRSRASRYCRSKSNGTPSRCCRASRQPSSRCWLGREVSGLSPMMPMTRWPLAYNCSIITAAAARSSTLTLDRFSMPSPAALFVSSRQGMPSDASAGVKHCGCAPMKKKEAAGPALGKRWSVRRPARRY